MTDVHEVCLHAQMTHCACAKFSHAHFEPHF